MASVDDVAAAVLERHGPMTAMKLEKLVYYAQAVALASGDEPLFDDPIEAWKNGPVVRSLYAKHRGRYSLSEWDHGSSANLSDDDLMIVDTMLSIYGDMSADWLSSQSHIDEPWRRARTGVAANVSSRTQISREDMAEYYRAVLDDPMVNAALAAGPPPAEAFDNADEIGALRMALS